MLQENRCIILTEIKSKRIVLYFFFLAFIAALCDDPKTLHLFLTGIL